MAAPGVLVAELPLVAFPRLFSLVAPGVPFPVAELPLVARARCAPDAPGVPLARG